MSTTKKKRINVKLFFGPNTYGKKFEVIVIKFYPNETIITVRSETSRKKLAGMKEAIKQINNYKNSSIYIASYDITSELIYKHTKPTTKADLIRLLNNKESKYMELLKDQMNKKWWGR